MTHYATPFRMVLQWRFDYYAKLYFKRLRAPGIVPFTTTTEALVQEVMSA